MDSACIIPARFGSTRLKGKPLKKIKDKTLLQMVIELCQHASDTPVYVATDHEEIFAHAKQHGAIPLMTSSEIATGSDRVYEASRQLPSHIKYLVNVQGDCPFIPPSYIQQTLERLKQSPHGVVTPAIQLSWDELEQFQEHKKNSPSSGTTVTINTQNQALWFSKSILPYIRKPDPHTPFSPVLRHVGIYGFTKEFLKTFVHLPQTHYEQIEGLEQLRILEHGYPIEILPLTTTTTTTPSTTTPSKKNHPLSGIDTPQDLAYANSL